MIAPRPLTFLRMEELDARVVPAMLAGPWADAEHITVSFVPDGTPTPNGPSRLFQTMNAVAPQAVWQKEILRGIQSWLNTAKINVGVSGDNGAALGSSGAVQGDTRYGDIRVSAAPMPEDTFAQGSPFHWTGTTLSGDIAFNSDTAFRVGGTNSAAKDLFSVALHEAGHTFGLDHSELPSSVMQEEYAVYTGLGAPDVFSIQTLYGVRVADAYDTAAPNNTAATATLLTGGLLQTQLLARGDLTTSSDVDYYKFNLPLLPLGTPISVRLKTSGISLLTAKVTVTSPSGTVVATANSVDALNGDLGLQFFSPLLFGGTYTVKVESTATDYRVGAYSLAVDLGLLGLLSPLTNVLSSVLDGNTNETLATATALVSLNPTGSAKKFDYYFNGSIETNSDKDNYRIVAPAAGSPNLNVLAWARGGSAVNPKVRVYDADTGVEIAASVLANEAGVMSVRIANVTPGAALIVAISGDGSTGDYALAADFNPYAAPNHVATASGTIANAPVVQSLAVDMTGFQQFLLQAGSGSVTLTLRNAAGDVVLTLTAAAGQTVSANRFLIAGNYTMTFTTTAPGTAFDLKRLDLSDSVGTYRPKTTSTARPTEASTDTASGSTSAPSNSPSYEF